MSGRFAVAMAALCALLLNVPARTAAVLETLAVRLDGDYLRVSLPHIDFLKGKSLERLKDGVSVAFNGQVAILPSPNSLTPIARSVARFAISYDIWEERFSVTKIGQAAGSRGTAAHLSAQNVENWCLDNLLIDRSQVPVEQPFYVQLDLRAEDPRDQLGIIGEPGINFTRLVEVLGRAPRSPQDRWLYNAGPFRLADLKKSEIRGARG